MKTYPYKAWRLSPSFVVREVTVTGGYMNYDQWVRIAPNNALVQRIELHDRKDRAVAAGYKKLELQEAKIVKQLEGMRKKRLALDKAAA